MRNVPHAFILKVLNVENLPSSEPRLKNLNLTLATIWDLSTLQNPCHVFKMRDCFLLWFINRKVCVFFPTDISFPPLSLLVIGIV